MKKKIKFYTYYIKNQLYMQKKYYIYVYNFQYLKFLII